jgi:ABC-type phosphate transport system substrate-binding protein
MSYVKGARFFGFLIAVLCCAGPARSQVDARVKASEDIAVVVNPANAYTSLSAADLRKILLGERKFWKSNVPVSLVLRQEGAWEREHILATLLRMTDADFEQHWQALIFRGEASAPPLAVPSNGMATEYVADTPGAISFIVGKNLRSDLKVLRIDGKLPGDSDYPLR